MSRPKLRSFLEKLRKELRKNAKFRENDADTAQNTFYFSPRELREALLFEFEFRKIEHLLAEGTPLNTWLTTRTNTMLTTLRERYKKGLSGRDTLGITGNQYFFKVVLQTEINPTKNKAFNNFTALRTKYKEEMDSLAQDLAKKVSDLGEKLLKTKNKNSRYKDGKRIQGFNPANNERVMATTEVDRGSDLVEAGHDEGFEILESKIQDAMNKAFNEEYPRRVDRKILDADLKKLGIDLEIERDDKSGTYQFRMQSTVDNQQKGFLSAQERQDFDAQLLEAINKLDNDESILKLQGSSSMLEIKSDETVLRAIKPFEKIKGIKVTKPSKPKKRKSKVTEKGKTKSKKVTQPTLNIAVGAVRLNKVRRARQRTSQSSPASEMLRLIGVLNQRLPKKVRDNMQEPALQNRTGRFAESVKVTEVQRTPQGFPSVGYTYQKRPYERFEVGRGQAPWATPERDPRKLIDRSIREIAAELAVGRFYTRRV